MKRVGSQRLYISAFGSKQPVGPDDAGERARQEALVREDYDRCHLDDSFDDLKRRARFSKEDQGLLMDWMVLAANRAGQQPDVPASTFFGATLPAIGKCPGQGVVHPIANANRPSPQARPNCDSDGEQTEVVDAA